MKGLKDARGPGLAMDTPPRRHPHSTHANPAAPTCPLLIALNRPCELRGWGWEGERGWDGRGGGEGPEGLTTGSRRRQKRGIGSQ